MFEHIIKGTEESVDGVSETTALLRNLEGLCKDDGFIKIIEEAMRAQRSGYATFPQLLAYVEEEIESFTDGEIASIEDAFDIASNEKSAPSALHAIETLLAAIEAAREGI